MRATACKPTRTIVFRYALAREEDRGRVMISEKLVWLPSSSTILRGREELTSAVGSSQSGWVVMHSFRKISDAILLK